MSAQREKTKKEPVGTMAVGLFAALLGAGDDALAGDLLRELKVDKEVLGEAATNTASASVVTPSGVGARKG